LSKEASLSKFKIKQGLIIRGAIYTEIKILFTTNTCNNYVYFLMLKYNHKVADVIIKPIKQEGRGKGGNNNHHGGDYHHSARHNVILP